jgi:hypothetical protein
VWYTSRIKTPRGAHMTPSHRRDLLLRLERTTGFEPATLTLAKKSGPTPLPASLQIHAARSAISIDHNEPRVSVVVNRACVFCAPRTAESRTTCTTSAAAAVGTGRAQQRDGRTRGPCPLSAASSSGTLGIPRPSRCDRPFENHSGVSLVKLGQAIRGKLRRFVAG